MGDGVDGVDGSGDRYLCCMKSPDRDQDCCLPVVHGIPFPRWVGIPVWNLLLLQCASQASICFPATLVLARYVLSPHLISTS